MLRDMRSNNGVGHADNPSDHKVISLVQYAICSLLLHVVTPGVVYGLCITGWTPIDSFATIWFRILVLVPHCVGFQI